MGWRAEVTSGAWRLEVILRDLQTKAELMTRKPKADQNSWAEPLKRILGAKGCQRGKAEELDGFGRGEERERLCRTIRDERDLEQGRTNG